MLNYAQTFEWDASKIEPQVAAPHLPSNVKPVSQFKDVKIDQSVIGSCTNGRLEDLQNCRPNFERQESSPLCALYQSSPALSRFTWRL